MKFSNFFIKIAYSFLNKKDPQQIVEIINCQVKFVLFFEENKWAIHLMFGVLHPWIVCGFPAIELFVTNKALDGVRLLTIDNGKTGNSHFFSCTSSIGGLEWPFRESRETSLLPEDTGRVTVS